MISLILHLMSPSARSMAADTWLLCVWLDAHLRASARQLSLAKWRRAAVATVASQLVAASCCSLEARESRERASGATCRSRACAHEVERGEGGISITVAMIYGPACALEKWLLWSGNTAVLALRGGSFARPVENLLECVFSSSLAPSHYLPVDEILISCLACRADCAALVAPPPRQRRAHETSVEKRKIWAN